MAQATLSPVEQALRLIGTPLALEALSDLAHGRPITCDEQMLADALVILTEVGAIESPGPSTLAITAQGRELCSRLEEIELNAPQRLRALDDLDM